MPFDADTQARIFYLVLLGAFVAVWVFQRYRGRVGQAAQHLAIWGLIFVGVVLAYGFSDTLTRQLMVDRPVAVDSRTVAVQRARDGHFYAEAEVNGTPVRFMIDTGASKLVLSRRDARAAGIDPEGLSYIEPVVTANGRSMSAPVRLETIALGGFVDRDVRASVNGGPLDVSLLGMSYLDRYSSIRFEGDTLYLVR